MQILLEGLSNRILRGINNTFYKTAPWLSVGNIGKDVVKTGTIAKDTSPAMLRRHVAAKSGSLGLGIYGTSKILKHDEKMHRRGSRLRKKPINEYIG